MTKEGGQSWGSTRDSCPSHTPHPAGFDIRLRESAAAASAEALRHSTFDILSSFGLRHSSFRRCQKGHFGDVGIRRDLVADVQDHAAAEGVEDSPGERLDLGDRGRVEKVVEWLKATWKTR